MKLLSRRAFLGGMTALGAAALWPRRAWAQFATHTPTPASLAATTPRDAADFVFPQDVTGGEAFWGADVLFTIDDCNQTPFVRAMFELFQQRGLQASFFPNSAYLNLDDPEVRGLWREIHAAGYDIGYHTSNHDQGWLFDELVRDFALFTDHMRALLDDPEFSIRFVRPPFGIWDGEWMRWVQVNGLVNVRWNFVPNKDRKELSDFEQVTQHPDGGRIILIHPRDWDTRWLTRRLDDYVAFAAAQGGRVARLSGAGR